MRSRVRPRRSRRARARLTARRPRRSSRMPAPSSASSKRPRWAGCDCRCVCVWDVWPGARRTRSLAVCSGILPVFTSAYSSAPRETARCILLVWRDNKWANRRGAERLKPTDAAHKRHTRTATAATGPAGRAHRGGGAGGGLPRARAPWPCARRPRGRVISVPHWTRSARRHIPRYFVYGLSI